MLSARTMGWRVRGTQEMLDLTRRDGSAASFAAVLSQPMGANDRPPFRVTARKGGRILQAKRTELATATQLTLVMVIALPALKKPRNR
jgi:hypothetical protein